MKCPECGSERTRTYTGDTHATGRLDALEAVRLLIENGNPGPLKRLAGEEE